MSEIVVEQTDLNITITPNTTQLNVFAGGYATAQGNTTEVQYNNGGVLAGANGLTYNSGLQTTTAGNLTVTNNTDLGSIGNITITGGNSGEVLTTDGSGGLSFSEIANANFASFAGNVIEAAQPNITSVGNLSNLTVSGNVTANFFIGNGSQLTGLTDPSTILNGSSNVVVTANGNVRFTVSGNTDVLIVTSTGIVTTGANLGNVSNLIITGGTNGQYLQTDGTGNLSWSTGGGSGNGVVGGSNTQIQYNNAGSFGGSPAFTFNNTSNVITVTELLVGPVQGPIRNLAYGTENVSLITAQTGTYNFDFIDNSIRFTTSNASANVTLNIRGNSTVTANSIIGNGQSITCTYVLKTGSTPYYVSNVNVDGNVQSINWVNQTAPVVFSNSYTSYTFTVVKTSTTPTYVVLGSGTRYAQ